MCLTPCFSLLTSDENILHAFYIFYISVCHTTGPLGMITGDIKDWQISASSAYPNEWDNKCREKYARVYLENKYGWCAKYKSASEWLQVDLGVSSRVSRFLLVIHITPVSVNSTQQNNLLATGFIFPLIITKMRPSSFKNYFMGKTGSLSPISVSSTCSQHVQLQKCQCHQ